MREQVRDELRLQHILDACDRLLSYYPQDNIPLLDDRSIEFFGVVKNLEIIGEAAYKLTKEFVADHSLGLESYNKYASYNGAWLLSS